MFSVALACLLNLLSPLQHLFAAREGQREVTWWMLHGDALATSITANAAEDKEALGQDLGKMK